MEVQVDVRCVPDKVELDSGIGIDDLEGVPVVHTLERMQVPANEDSQLRIAEPFGAFVTIERFPRRIEQGVVGRRRVIRPEPGDGKHGENCQD